MCSWFVENGKRKPKAEGANGALTVAARESPTPGGGQNARKVNIERSISILR